LQYRILSKHQNLSGVGATPNREKKKGRGSKKNRSLPLADWGGQTSQKLLPLVGRAYESRFRASLNCVPGGKSAFTFFSKAKQ
jgi:hypothetical protein